MNHPAESAASRMIADLNDFKKQLEQLDPTASAARHLGMARFWDALYQSDDRLLDTCRKHPDWGTLCTFFSAMERTRLLSYENSVCLSSPLQTMADLQRSLSGLPDQASLSGLIARELALVDPDIE